MVINVYDDLGSMKGGSFDCSSMDPSVQPPLDSPDTILVRFTRQNGRLVRFTYNTATSELDNDSQTGERAEFIVNTDNDVTGYLFYNQRDEIEEYDADGRLITITSLNGHVKTLSYITDADTGGILLDLVQNDTGEYLDFNYELVDALKPFKRINNITDYTGRGWGIRFDDIGNPEYIDNPDGSTRQYHYEDVNNNDFLTGITDERGNRYASWEYNTNGKAISSSHGVNNNIEKVTIQYDETFNTHTVTSVREFNDGTPKRDVDSTYKTHLAGGSKVVAEMAGPGCKTCGTSNTKYDHDVETGKLESKTENGIKTKYSNYNDKGNPEQITEAAGTTEEYLLTYSFDARFFDKITSVTAPSVYSAGFKVTNYTYDDFANITDITINGFKPDGTAVSRTSTLKYDGPFHQISEVDGPRTDVNDIYLFDYYPDDAAQNNNRSRLSSIRTFDGNYLRSNIHYTTTGKVESEDLTNNLHIDYVYYPGNDRLHNMIQTDVISGKARTTRWTYLPTGEIESITEAADTGSATTLTLGYDTARRLTRITDGLGNYIEYVLDSEGNVEKEDVYDASGALKKTLDQTFDNYNRLEKFSQLNENQDVNFNPNGTIDTVTEGKGSVSKYEYDSLKRLTRITQDQGGINPDTANALTQFGYDVQDNLTSVTDANNGLTSYVYDDLGNLLSRTSPDTGTVTYAHDEAGNIVQATDAKSQVFTYRYDALNRLSNIDAPGTEDDVSYVYDTCAQGFGNLCQTQRSNSTLSYEYNGFGDVASLDQSLITWAGYNTAENTIDYVYDAAGRISHMTYPSGAIINYSYNAAGKVDNVYLDQNGVITSLTLNIKYNPFGRESVQTYGNALSILGMYDQAYRPFIIGEAAFYFDYIMSYDENGNIKQSRTRDSSSYLDQSFDYDEHNRLESSTGYSGNYSYDYDSVGNKKQKIQDGVTTAFTYQVNSNRLSNLDGVTTGIDSNGNVTNLRGMGLTFTTDNRLKSVNTGVVFEYNGLGQRIRKLTSAPGAAGTYGYSQSTSYIYGLNGELLAEIGPTGSVKKEYVYLNNQPLAMLNHTPSSNEPIFNADLDNDGEISVEDFLVWYFNHRTDVAYEVTGDGVAASDDINAVINCGLNQSNCVAASYSTDIYYVHNDHLGTPKMLSNSSGHPVWRATARPFGKASVNNDVDGDGVEVEFNIRQPGQYYDRESGLYYNYYRYYDPETGRYITADPLGVLPGASPTPNLPESITSQYASQSIQKIVQRGLNHTYAYVENNPLSFIDPLGLHHGRPHGQMGHGSVGQRGCRTTCITNYIGGGLLAAGAGMGFGALAGSGWVAGTTGYLGSSANALYSNFSLGACLDQCNKEEDSCKL